mgnify:FL=1
MTINEIHGIDYDVWCLLRLARQIAFATPVEAYQERGSLMEAGEILQAKLREAELYGKLAELRGENQP